MSLLIIWDSYYVRQVLLRECRAVEVVFSLLLELRAVLGTKPSQANVNFAIKVVTCACL